MKKWIPLFLTQFLGILNDNLLKHLIIFVGVLWLSEESKEIIIPIASALLVLPYILFSPIAGMLSSIKQKKTILRVAKFAEIPIMGIAIIGFWKESMIWLLISLFTMGLQSALYSPSKLGLIKDIAGKTDLNKGTGTMDFLGFVAILVSTIGAGFIADFTGNQLLLLSVVLIGVALAGWISSTRVNATNNTNNGKTGESILPLRFLKQAYYRSKKTKGLNRVVLALGMFWFIASLLQMNLFVYCAEVLNLSATQISFVIGFTIVGIALGCFVAGVINKHRVEIGISVAGAIGLAIFTSIIAFAELSLTGFHIIMFLGSFCAGLYKIPLNSWMQERCTSEELPSKLAYLNMVVFIIILISSGIFALFISAFSSKAVFILIASTSVLLSGFMLVKNPAEFIRFLVYCVARSIYKMKIRGTHHIPKNKGALIVANHLSFMDFVLIVGAVPRKVRYVMFKDVYDHKLLNWLFRSLNMIPISPRGRNNLTAFNELCQKEINNGHVVVIFAEGMVTRNGHLHEFKRGMEHIARGIHAPIIPIHMDGVIGTPFTYLSGRAQAEKFRLKNLRQKVFVNIGTPLRPDTSAFEVRQVVTELNADNLENRIQENQLIHHEMINYSFANKRLTAFHSERGIITHKTLLKRVFARAKALQKVLDGKSTAILHIDDELEYRITCIAMSIAGKTSIPAAPDGSNIHILRREFRSNVVLTDMPIGDVDFTPIWLSQLHEETISMALLKCLKFFKLLDPYFGNQHDKYDKVLISVVDDQRIGLTHQNLIASIYGIDQVNNLSEYGITRSFLEQETAIANLLDVWLPASKPINGAVSDHVSGINTIIGQERKLVEKLASIDTSNIQNIITDYGVDGIIEDVFDTTNVNLQTGFGMFANIPLLCLNTKDYNGKDIAGKPLIQIGSNPYSAGRPLPGLAVKVVQEGNPYKHLSANEVGTILIRGAQIAHQLTIKSADYLNGWLNTNLRGFLDEKGFLHFV